MELDELYESLKGLAILLDEAGDAELASEIRGSLAGSTSGEILGSARAVLRRVRRSPIYANAEVRPLVDAGLAAINQALGGWWRA